MNISEFKYILFDLDGTLTDSAPGITNAVRYALGKMDIEVKKSDNLLKFIGPPLLDSFNEFYGLDKASSIQAVSFYREYYRDRGIFESSVYEGIEYCLNSLKNAGKRLVLATSKPQQFAERILEHFGLSQYFDFVFGATMDEKRTKKFEVIEYAISTILKTDEDFKSGMSDESNTESAGDILDKFLMVGDRENDISGAHINNIASMGVLFGFGDYDELYDAGADFIVKSPSDISDILLSEISEIISFKTIDSTNNEAKRLVNERLVTKPVLILADSQTNGRGRQGKDFYSPASTGLYMTLLYPVNASVSSQVTMTTRTAVAVARALENEFNIYPEIKWVNDIYVKKHKCCGILCEAVNDYEKMVLKYAVIGVGVNISTSEWPKELQDKAGSFFEACESGNVGYGSDFTALAVRIGNQIIKLFSDKSDSSFLDYYREHSNVIGREITYIENNKEFRAFAVDIDESGALIVRLESDDGIIEEKSLNSGEISLLLG